MLNPLCMGGDQLNAQIPNHGHDAVDAGQNGIGENRGCLQPVQIEADRCEWLGKPKLSQT